MILYDLFINVNIFIILNTEVYSSFIPLYNLTKQSPKNVSLNCYGQHPCKGTPVQIVWYVTIYNTEDKEIQTFSSDVTSERTTLEDKHEITLQSKCPEYECYSELTVPSSIINGTTVWCGAWTEVCPQQVAANSSKTVFITSSIPCMESTLVISLNLDIGYFLLNLCYLAASVNNRYLIILSFINPFIAVTAIRRFEVTPH